MTDARKNAPFRRPGRRLARINATDLSGEVTVQVWIRDPKNSQHRMAGNISRTIAVADAKVSEVLAVIETALFGAPSRG